MLNKLAHVDYLLIDRLCQPVADWIFQVFTSDCFRTARLCMDLSALMWILSQAHSAVMAARRGVPGLMAFQVALIVIGLGSIMTLRWVFERGGGNHGGRVNPLRAPMFPQRFACLLWVALQVFQASRVPFDLVALARVLVAGFATVGVYIGACSNRPPVRWDYRSGIWRPAEARGR